jgi:hypothetical protein
VSAAVPSIATFFSQSYIGRYVGGLSVMHGK